MGSKPTPHMPSRCDTLPTKVLRQLSYLSSSHSYKPRQGKASTLVNSNLVFRVIKIPISILSDVHECLTTTKQYNTIKKNLRQLFPKKKLHSGGIHLPCLTHSRYDALQTELLRELSWLISNHPYKPRQSKQASQPDKLVNSSTVCVHVMYMHVHTYLLTL